VLEVICSPCSVSRRQIGSNPHQRIGGHAAAEALMKEVRG